MLSKNINMSTGLVFSSVNETFLVLSVLPPFRPFSHWALCGSPLLSKCFKASHILFPMFSTETESKVCYLNTNLTHTIFRDQWLILHPWIMHGKTCGVSGVAHLCKQKEIHWGGSGSPNSSVPFTVQDVYGDVTSLSGERDSNSLDWWNLVFAFVIA